MAVPARYLPLAVGLGFTVFGIAFVVFGIRAARRHRRFAATAERTTGLCVDLEYRTGRSNTFDSTTTGGWAPRMRFTTRDGREVEATSGTWSTPAPVRRGHTAPLLYDPADPRRFHVANLRGSGGCIPPLFIAFGSTAAVVGLVVLGVTLGVLAGR